MTPLNPVTDGLRAVVEWSKTAGPLGSSRSKCTTLTEHASLRERCDCDQWRPELPMSGEAARIVRLTRLSAIGALNRTCSCPASDRTHISHPQNTDRLEVICEGDTDTEELASQLTAQLGISPDTVTLVDELDEGPTVVDERY